jgi:hypothetical protein
MVNYIAPGNQAQRALVAFELTYSVLAQLNTAQEFVYHAVRNSYIINPTHARPRAGREGEGGGGESMTNQ